MSLTTSRAPSAANSSAVARPMPRAAPVTRTDLPASRPLMGAAYATGVNRCAVAKRAGVRAGAGSDFTPTTVVNSYQA